MTFSGQTIWLTGASSGIGESLVGPLVEAGARVAITARRASALEAVAARFPTGLVEPVPADVTDRGAVTAAARAIEARWGNIDLAIFNAGTHIPVRGTAVNADDFETLVRVNYLSVIYGIEAVLPAMLARGQGHIAGVASLAGYRALPTAAAYGASKAAVILALDALRFDLQPRGIHVTVINPGFVRTPLTDLNTFPMPALIDADRAARIIVRGLARRKKEIHFPARFSWMMKLLRVLPYPVFERLVSRTTLG
ncbi:MAG: SDR family NAD(P)-dependent oxidoreductase [Acidobacteriota bacterium]|nr:SDR family NAD(P)-dependent oxidoreductase [Acidobacteriota bacterium]